MKNTPKPFEMPFDRLLTDDEKENLNDSGLTFKQIDCLACSNSGWTSDGREYCSVRCYCIEHGLDITSFDLIKKAVFLDEASCVGDQVIYDECLMKVVTTDCTKERLQRDYNLKYSYVLEFDGRSLILRDIEVPLRKIKMDLKNEEI